MAVDAAAHAAVDMAVDVAVVVAVVMRNAPANPPLPQHGWALTFTAKHHQPDTIDRLHISGDVPGPHQGGEMLAKLEQKLESMISGAFARAFRSAVQPVEIAAALQRECDNNAQILSRDRRMVPNDFHVELSESDLDRLAPMDRALVDDLSRQLQDHADNQSYVFPGPIRIALEPADDLTTGRFRIRSRAQARVEGTATATQTRRAMAYVDINGTHNPLHAPIIVVGRGSEADIRINDPGVSRRHIEFHTRQTPEGTVVEVVDLGSTNGMTVNGTKVPRAVLADGATVTIGSTTMTLRFLVESVEESGV